MQFATRRDRLQHEYGLMMLAERAARRAKTVDEGTGREYDWSKVARSNQLPPVDVDWAIWLLMAGRGFGKSRSGAEWVRSMKDRVDRIALVAPTAADTRDVMVEGESGLLAISPPWDRPLYEPSKRRVSWRNGSMATLYSADEPERLRGPQHSCAWADELGSWRYPDAWDQLMFGLRLGKHPQVVVTTTPRPTKIIRDLVERNGRDVVVVRGSTYDNRDNLPASFFAQIVSKYEGTRLGRQEIDAELLEDVPGALWTRDMIEVARLRGLSKDLERVVVAIDPAATSGEDSDETGIIVAAKDAAGHGYVLADASGRYTPREWAQMAIGLYRTHEADRIVAEVNNGGEMVEATIRMVDPDVPFTAVRATRGKVVRAEPVAALYEQGRVHHLGQYPKLEDQMVMFTTDFDKVTAGFSPDRVDALVWAFSDLLVEATAFAGLMQWYAQQTERMGNGALRNYPNEHADGEGDEDWMVVQKAGHAT